MKDSILILGSSGYIGSAFVAECERRGIYHYHTSRAKHHYDSPFAFNSLLDQTEPALVINCAAFIPAGTVDACKDHELKSFRANAHLPGEWAKVCDIHNIPFMHLSTGCLFDEQREYTEEDAYTRDLKGYCGVYLKHKLAAELTVSGYNSHYILRLRLPFDEFSSPRNYLTKLTTFPTIWDHVNSLSHRGDFVKAALDLWQLKAPWGTYNVVNPGCASSREIIMAMLSRGIIPNCPDFDEQPPASGCRLSTEKLRSAGVEIRHILDALDHSLKNWKPCTRK